MSKLSFLIFLVIVIICVLVSLASGANLIQFGTRQPGDVEIFRIANESLVSEEIEMHATYFKWEQHGGRQYTAGEITVNKWTAAYINEGSVKEYFEYVVEDAYSNQIQAELVVYGFE